MPRPLRCGSEVGEGIDQPGIIIGVRPAKTVLVQDDETWAGLRKAEAKFLSEFDDLFSVAALERLYAPVR